MLSLNASSLIVRSTSSHFLQMISDDVMTLPQLPPGTEPLVHQVAGHFYGRSKTKFGLLQRCSNGNVLKPLLNPPRGPREHKFYTHIFSANASSELRALRPFLPQLLGTYEFGGMTYLELENAIRSYQCPCVIDIKLGRITYDQEATPEKIERQIAKFEPAAEIGFQLLGWKSYQQSDNSYIYHDKKCSRSLTKDEVLHGLAHFFGAPERNIRAIVHKVLDRLNDLERIMVKQFEFVFIASSLLIIYEGKAQDSETHKVEYPVDYDLEEQQKKPHAACDLLRYDLKMCLLASDCCKLGHTPKECLSNEKLREFVPEECRRLSYTFFECKRSMIDMRARFRGRKGEIY
ncbi:unnamed protein product [Adineta ricciae]|uniref:Kinase n=1 Tax=Adineta ricciae TaxID=249248 RepID=A0A815FD01_ADIRI|nr:unnamed protein product [Adineta ricciae]CAF1326927.1 unnamed protein product [Adineta ricciae]